MTPIQYREIVRNSRAVLDGAQKEFNRKMAPLKPIAMCDAFLAATDGQTNPGTCSNRNPTIPAFNGFMQDIDVEEDFSLVAEFLKRAVGEPKEGKTANLSFAHRQNGFYSNRPEAVYITSHNAGMRAPKALFIIEKGDGKIRTDKGIFRHTYSVSADSQKGAWYELLEGQYWQTNPRVTVPGTKHTDLPDLFMGIGFQFTNYVLPLEVNRVRENVKAYRTELLQALDNS